MPKFALFRFFDWLTETAAIGSATGDHRLG
jgi:hypothetical protein